MIPKDAWLTLELTNLCNLDCPFCYQNHGHIQPKGLMSFEHFKKIIDGIIENKNKFVNFNPFHRGEALLHPDFNKMMKYVINQSEVNSPFFDFMVLHTNANLLDNEKIDLLLDIGSQRVFKYPGNLFFSIDAASTQSYNKIRPGGNYEKVVDNIKKFILKREAINQFGPSVVLQFIIQEENEKEAKEFVNFWSNFFKENNIDFNIDKNFGDEIGEVQRTNIYLRRLQGPTVKMEDNIKRQKQVFEDLGL
jgi:sulfatase maturation enzyme AslB (radical SAM superfamily)